MSLNLQLILIAGSVLFLALTVYYIRRWGLDLYNSIRWFAGAVVLLLLALFPGVVEHFSRWAGVEVPSNLIFLAVIAYLMITSLSLSAAVSKQHDRIKKLTQELAMAEKRIRKIEEEIGKYPVSGSGSAKEEQS